MGLEGILLGFINIAIYVGVLILVGLIIVWLLSYASVTVPDQIKKVYMFIVAAIALYMIVALLFGLPFGSRRIL